MSCLCVVVCFEKNQTEGHGYGWTCRRDWELGLKVVATFKFQTPSSQQLAPHRAVLTFADAPPPHCSKPTMMSIASLATRNRFVSLPSYRLSSVLTLCHPVSASQPYALSLAERTELPPRAAVLGGGISTIEQHRLPTPIRHPCAPVVVGWMWSDCESQVQLELMNRNARKPKRANHGARPCSRISRRAKKRALGNHRR